MTINAIFNLCTKNVESLDENGEEDYKKLRTLMVIGDIECLIEYDVEGRNVLVADLIRYTTEDDPRMSLMRLVVTIALNSLSIN